MKWPEVVDELLTFVFIIAVLYLVISCEKGRLLMP